MNALKKKTCTTHKLTQSPLFWIACITLFPAALIVLTIIKTDAPLSTRPGFGRRLQRYLSQNQAETSNSSPYPELHTPMYMEPPEDLYKVVLAAIEKQGWTLTHSSQDRLEIKVEIKSPWLRFKDDMFISVKGGEAGLSCLHIKAQSRVGRSDMGANIRHIMDLKETINRLRLKAPHRLESAAT